MHPIEHVGNVPLSMEDGKEKYMVDVLHVPTITKNLVSGGQMVEQGLQVRFSEHAILLKISEISADWLLKVTRMEGCLNSM